MYEYEVETLAHETIQEALSLRGSTGWELTQAVVHPTETQNEQPKIIVFWRRELP